MRFIFIVLLSIATCSGATERAPVACSAEESSLESLVARFNHVHSEFVQTGKAIEATAIVEMRGGVEVVSYVREVVDLHAACTLSIIKMREFAQSLRTHPAFEMCGEELKDKVERWL